VSKGKLAIVDLDGVIADNTARFAKAEEEKQAFREEMDIIDSIPGTPAVRELEKEATNLFWKTAFDPELVVLDTLIEGTKEALETLRFRAEYDLLFLTSRPEAMRAATIQWLFQHNILFFGPIGPAALIMKPPAFQFTKTTTWKVGMVQTFIELYGARTVLFIDDEETNCEALRLSPLPLVPGYYHSLKEACDALQEEGHGNA